MDLLTATGRIKKALSNRDYIANLTHYHLKNGRAYASNGALTASAPIDEPLERVIPADELDKALSILGTDAQFIWTDEVLTIKKGRKKIDIRLLKPENVSLIEPVTLKYPLPTEFTDSIKLVRPFISQDASRPWALVAWLRMGPDGKHVWTATNNVVVVEVDAEYAENVNLFDCQIPNFALDFILERDEKLTHLGIAETKVSFFFDDGSELTSKLFSTKMPDQVCNIVSRCYDTSEGLFELNEDWKDAYKHITELMPEEIVMGIETMVASKGQATMEVSVKTTPPRDTSKAASYWNPKFLTPVVDVATHIDFGNYPNPIRFLGPGVRGLMVGKTI